jgi:zinc protease
MRILARLPLAIAAWACATALALPANVEHVETFRGVSQYRLKSNGMTILLAPDATSPVFTFMVVYHVGSRNEAPGNTGSAHLLEHMIFNKSTENFGRAKGHKTFQEALFEAGADFTSTNMTTSYDRMNGYSTLPADKLELAMRIEADRLQRGLILDSERQSEMSVVRNEYEIGENNPSQALFKATVSAAIQAHPYHWSVIGYRSDIEGVTTEKLREHYKTYFWPNNAEAVLVGDFEREKALALFDREFGAFPRSPHAIPQVITVEPPQQGERRVVVRRPGTLNLALLAYMRPGAAHEDYPALVVLGSILSDGVNSRLHQALVETGLATTVAASNFSLRDPFPMLVSTTLAPGKGHREAEDAIKATLATVVEKGVTDEEVRRAQQQIEVTVTRSRDGTFNYARSLGEAIGSTNWKWLLTYVDNVRRVTSQDVQRVAARYLVAENATVGWFIPGAPARTPVLALGTTGTAAKAGDGHPAPLEARQAGTHKTFAQRTVRKRLANGLTLDVVENHAVPTVAIRGSVPAGDISAPAGQRVLPDLMANMLSRGTQSRSKEEIGRILEDAGARRAYGSDLGEMVISASALARDLELVLGVLADELKNPALRPEELAKAKSEVENGYRRAADDTAARALQRLRQLIFGPAHPYYSTDLDTNLAGLRAATADDLRAFHRARYGGAGMILAIVGDVDAPRVVTLVERLFGDLPRGERSLATAPRLSPQDAPAREVVTLRGKANMNFMMGAASGLRRGDPDYEAALIANAALGQSSLSSRIGKRVRDTEGLSYALGSRFAMSEELDGLWYVNVNVAPQNLAKAMRSTREEVEKFGREGITAQEVEVQKSFFAGNFQVGLGSNAGIANTLAIAERYGFGPSYLDTYPGRIRAVTVEQANAALRKHFFPDKLHVIVAGDLDKLPD